MRYALFSDIHSNLLAFEACLNHASTQSVDRKIILGDMVGYGANPIEVVTLCQEIQAQGGIVLRGNHEELIQTQNVNKPSVLRSKGAIGSLWTHDQLTPAQRFWLEIQPLSVLVEDILFVHASADDPQSWKYVDHQNIASLSLEYAHKELGARYVFGGHVHHQSLFYRGTRSNLMQFDPTPGIPIPVPKHREWIATVGSVGQPRDGSPKAMYCIFDVKKVSLTFHRIEYDHFEAAKRIRRAGLPASLADRLELGL
jgi:diadenosine tetraphosphatase ApaH/serine/threonine PP2A family protein phosphatase